LRQRLTRVLGGVAMLTLVVSGAACNKPSTTTVSDKCGLELATFGALTGASGSFGSYIRDGAQLAVDQYNAKNKGCEVTLKPFDSEGSPDKAPGLARQLVADTKIVGVIGPAFSGESEAANPIFEEAGVTVITPSATRPSLSTKGWKVFHRAVANDDKQGPAAASYIKNVLKATKVFVADDQSAYGAGLADVVKANLGSLVIGTDKTLGEGKQTDFSTTVTKVKASGATAIFYGGYYTNAGLLAKQLKAAGVTITLIGGDGVNNTDFAKTAGNDVAEGTIVTCPCAPPTAAKGTFVTDYKAKYKADPGLYGDVGFDVANMFLKGIDAGNTTNAKMLSFVNTLQYTGVANTYKFTNTGELDAAYLIVWAYKFKGGDTIPDQAITL